MAIQENLRVEDLQALEETFNKVISPRNPEATFKGSPMAEMKNALEKGKDENELLTSISHQLDHIENLIKKIFGDHVLINGQFVDIKKSPAETSSRK